MGQGWHEIAVVDVSEIRNVPYVRHIDVVEPITATEAKSSAEATTPPGEERIAGTGGQPADGAKSKAEGGVPSAEPEKRDPGRSPHRTISRIHKPWPPAPG